MVSYITVPKNSVILICLPFSFTRKTSTHLCYRPLRVGIFSTLI